MMVVQACLNIVQHCHILEKTDILEGTGNTCLVDVDRFLSCDIRTIQADSSLIRRIHTGKHIKYRRLAGTVRSDQTVKLSLLDGNMKIIYRTKASFFVFLRNFCAIFCLHSMHFGAQLKSIMTISTIE